MTKRGFLVGAARSARSITFAALGAAGLCQLGGCSAYWQKHFADRELVTTGLGERPAQISFDLPYAYYDDEPAQTSLLLSDIPLEKLAEGGPLNGQVVHIQMVWLPRPGWTPIKPSSTNLVIRLLIFSDGEVGLYGGGGFAWPWDEPGDPSFGMQITGSSLALLEKTPGFVDLLSPAQMLGIADAPLDKNNALRMKMAASQAVTNAFKSVHWVRVWEGSDPALECDHADARDHVEAAAHVDAASAASCSMIAGSTASRSGS